MEMNMTVSVKTTKLEDIAQEARAAFKDCQRLGQEGLTTITIGARRGIEFGALLNKAKALIEHGDWGKWMSDNFRDIPNQTYTRWMKKAKFLKMGNLTDGEIIALCLEKDEEKPERKAIGTHEVIIFDSFLSKLSKPTTRALTMLESANVEQWPEVEREKLKATLEPLRPVIGKLFGDLPQANATSDGKSDVKENGG